MKNVQCRKLQQQFALGSECTRVPDSSVVGCSSEKSHFAIKMEFCKFEILFSIE